MKDQKLLSVRAAADALGMSANSLYRMVEGGQVPCFRVGAKRRGVRICLEEVREALRCPAAQ